MKKILKITIFAMGLLMLTVSCKKEKKKTLYGCVGTRCFGFEIENVLKYSNATVVKIMTDRPGYCFEFSTKTFLPPIEITRSDWKDNGFTIALPKIANTICLFTFWYSAPPTVLISNRDAKWTCPWISLYDRFDNWEDGLVLAKKTKDGYVMARFIYIDSDITVSGHHSFSTIYSIEWKIGWNWLVESYSTETGIRRVSSTLVDGLKWHLTSETNFW